MFSRSKTDSPAGSTPPGVTPAPVPLTTEAGETASGKGRPTPKRKTAQAANKRPLVPTDRKAAAKADRQRRRELRERRLAGIQAGDEKYFDPKDRGPIPRYVRDFVDARWNLAEHFLPLAMVGVVALLFAQQWPVVSLIAVFVLYGFLFLTVVDAFLMWQSLKKRLRAKFGEVPPGTMMYAVTRTYQGRRRRLPPPTSPKRGNYPD